jgi:hypothetical protein
LTRALLGIFLLTLLRQLKKSIKDTTLPVLISKAMKNSWYSYNRRPRSRLRKRKNNPYWPGFFSKYYSDTANNRGVYDKNRILDSGFTVGESWGCLEKAWVGFRAAKRLENDEDMKLYASIIQRLEKELKIEVNDFPELGLCACNLEEANTEEEEDQRPRQRRGLKTGTH